MLAVHPITAANGGKKPLPGGAERRQMNTWSFYIYIKKDFSLILDG